MKNPLVFVLFGATGDLAVKKIFPALEALWKEGALGDHPHIVATGRRGWDDQAFRAFLDEVGTVTPGFLGLVSYADIDVGAGTGYDELRAQIGRMLVSDGGPTGEPHIMFYSSLAPRFHGEVAKALHASGLISCGRGKLLIEKPFGEDEGSAKALDRSLRSFLDDDQIFRVDHYLGKDALRAVMDLHENTPELAHLISADAVQSITIAIFETKGIDGRGVSYDDVGAFKDVGQNHVLEMLAAIAAEPGAKGWQAARADVLKRLAPPAKTCELSRRGQYEGYEHEKGVAEGSDAETAFEVITSLKSGKLKKVPLTLVAGKKMPTAKAFIEVVFKDVQGLPKKMTFNIQPEQDIVIEDRDGGREAFDIKKTRDAYGNVILAALEGSERSFVGSDEIRALWAYTDRVVACWSKVPLERYGPDKPFLIK
ncbi:MAG TPA: hypothetical protein VHD69_00235 [Candidatus Paceibacterota bacterium]|nr:hypothetical protein [Candidatus Paceibacterota bacterium]